GPGWRGWKALGAGARRDVRQGARGDGECRAGKATPLRRRYHDALPRLPSELQRGGENAALGGQGSLAGNSAVKKLDSWGSVFVRLCRRWARVGFVLGILLVGALWMAVRSAEAAVGEALRGF